MAADKKFEYEIYPDELKDNLYALNPDGTNRSCPSCDGWASYRDRVLKASCIKFLRIPLNRSGAAQDIPKIIEGILEQLLKIKNRRLIEISGSFDCRINKNFYDKKPYLCLLIALLNVRCSVNLKQTGAHNEMLSTEVDKAKRVINFLKDRIITDRPDLKIDPDAVDRIAANMADFKMFYESKFNKFLEPVKWLVEESAYKIKEKLPEDQLTRLTEFLFSQLELFNVLIEANWAYEQAKKDAASGRAVVKLGDTAFANKAKIYFAKQKGLRIEYELPEEFDDAHDASYYEEFFNFFFEEENPVDLEKLHRCVTDFLSYLVKIRKKDMREHLIAHVGRSLVRVLATTRIEWRGKAQELSSQYERYKSCLKMEVGKSALAVSFDLADELRATTDLVENEFIAALERQCVADISASNTQKELNATYKVYQKYIEELPGKSTRLREILIESYLDRLGRLCQECFEQAKEFTDLATAYQDVSQESYPILKSIITSKEDLIAFKSRLQEGFCDAVLHSMPLFFKKIKTVEEAVSLFQQVLNMLHFKLEESEYWIPRTKQREIFLALNEHLCAAVQKVCSASLTTMQYREYMAQVASLVPFAKTRIEEIIKHAYLNGLNIMLGGVRYVAKDPFMQHKKRDKLKELYDFHVAESRYVPVDQVAAYRASVNSAFFDAFFKISENDVRNGRECKDVKEHFLFYRDILNNTAPSPAKNKEAQDKIKSYRDITCIYFIVLMIRESAKANDAQKIEKLLAPFAEATRHLFTLSTFADAYIKFKKDFKPSGFSDKTRRGKLDAFQQAASKIEAEFLVAGVHIDDDRYVILEESAMEVERPAACVFSPESEIGRSFEICSTKRQAYQQVRLAFAGEYQSVTQDDEVIARMRAARTAYVEAAKNLYQLDAESVHRCFKDVVEIVASELASSAAAQTMPAFSPPPYTAALDMPRSDFHQEPLAGPSSAGCLPPSAPPPDDAPAGKEAAPRPQSPSRLAPAASMYAVKESPAPAKGEEAAIGVSKDAAG